MNEQTPIMKIIILVIIITAFCAAIYIIATVFATKCPAGQHFDTDQKKCILTCDDGQVYNPANDECRDVCTGNQVWAPSLNICKDCGPGASWNETSQECLISCGSDGECTTGQSCINGQCCNYPACKTKDGDKCCETCTADPDNTGYSLCCAANKIYKDASGQTACCSAGQISDGTKCGVLCGPTGSTKICTPGNECLLIKNVDPKSSIFTQLNSNTDNSSEKNSDGTYNFYSCMGTKDMCNQGNANAFPPSIGNFYPCFDMGDTQTSDLLSKDTNDFNKDFPKDQGYGYYCGDNTQDLSRLYRINFENKDKCNYTNCLAAMANPYVTDIQYDESTGDCTSLQSCTQNISGLQIKDGNQNVGGKLPSCKNLPTDPDWLCNSKQQLAGYYCEPGSGLIQKKGYQCKIISDPPTSVGTKSINDSDGSCVCYPGSVGTTCQYSRILTCSGNGAPDPNTGTCKCDTFWVGTNCNTKQLSTDYYNQAWILNYVQQLRNTIISAPNNVKVDNVFGWENFVVILINNNGKLTYKDWNTNGTGGQYVTGVWVDPDAANPKSNAQVERHFLTPRQQGNGRGVSFQLLSAGGGPTYNLIFNINPGDGDDHGGVWYKMGTDQGYGETGGIQSSPPPAPMSVLLIQPNICVIYCTKNADGPN